jgi:hypothetical protein
LDLVEGSTSSLKKGGAGTSRETVRLFGRPGKEHQCSETRRTTVPVIVMTVIAIAKVSANKTNIF